MSILESQAKQNLLTMPAERDFLAADQNDSKRSMILATLIDNDLWTLAEYLAWMAADDEKKRAKGWWVGSLSEDLAHWAEIGITTASQLGRYLDDCCENERRKDMMG